MSDITDSDITKPLEGLQSSDNTLMKTVRLTINLITNILLGLTVFVTLMYAFGSKKLSAFELHIIFCVSGYQLFMCHGTLVLSNYNSWSMNLSRWNRKRIHILFQLLGFLLAVVGSTVIMCNERHHFRSLHEDLGVSALIISSLSIVNGAMANYAHKLSRSFTFLIRFTHYSCGILTLFVSAAALSTGFEEFPFRNWIKDNGAVIGLICITWSFTFFVALDIWLLSGQRLRNLS